MMMTCSYFFSWLWSELMKGLQRENGIDGQRAGKTPSNLKREGPVDPAAAGVGRGKSGGPGKPGGRKMRSKGGSKGY